MDLSKVEKDELIYNLTLMNNRPRKCIQYKTPKEEWIFKENTHEAIISQEQFDQVQKILEEKFNKPKTG